MKKIIISMFVIVIGFILLTASIMIAKQIDYSTAELDALEERVDNMHDEVVEHTVHTILADPSLLFEFLEDHPEWEAIEAVPYSECYKHLIGDETLTADYIMCKAI